MKCTLHYEFSKEEVDAVADSFGHKTFTQKEMEDWMALVIRSTVQTICCDE